MCVQCCIDMELGSHTISKSNANGIADYSFMALTKPNFETNESQNELFLEDSFIFFTSVILFSSSFSSG